MPPYRIAIVRSADELHELVYDARAEGPGDEPWATAPACTLQPYVPGRDAELADTWRALAAVTAWDEATMWRVYRVLLHTVPSGDDAGELAALLPEDVEPPEPPRATAAHPRAYRGTKTRPPKPAQLQPVDVRRYLLSRRHVEQVLARLPSINPESLGSDLYAWIWFSARGRGSTSAVDPWFATHVLPLLASDLADGAWSQVMEFHVAARALGLGDADHRRLRDTLVGILVEVARQIARHPLDFDVVAERARVLAWWRHILAHDSPARLEAAELALASGAWRRDPDGLAEVLAECRDLRDRWDVHRRFAVGQSCAYLLGGVRLFADLGERRPGEPPAWQTEAAAIGDVSDLVRGVMARLAEASQRDGGPAYWTARLWELCGEWPAMTELLASPVLAALAPAAAFWLIRLVASPGFGPDAPERYRALAPAAHEIAARAAAAAPAYQEKLVELVAWPAYWADGADEIRGAIARALPLAERLARPPLATARAVGWLLVRLRELPAPVLAAFLGAPDASLAILEHACRRDNDARLVAIGLEALLVVVPDFAIAAFAAQPRALVAAADALAALSPEAARDVVAAYARTPLAGAAIASAPLPELLAAVAVAGPGRRGPDPIRRALREHVAGTRVLTAPQLRGHHRRVVEALPAVRLAAIRSAAESALAARAKLPRAETPSLRHALAMIQEVDENRRPLRRLLVAHAAGDATWRLRHPRTEAWFARHRELDRARWLAGWSLTREIPGLGDVTFATETDLLEVLRVGTYVGTCIGRGGDHAYSAAAIALDANKHVVYARDARSDVVGRQLLAISEAGELVCFQVYGKSNHERLEAGFAELDRAFARSLGLPIHRSGKDRDHYTIAEILALRWWDDLSWDVPDA